MLVGRLSDFCVPSFYKEQQQFFTKLILKLALISLICVYSRRRRRMAFKENIMIMKVCRLTSYVQNFSLYILRSNNSVVIIAYLFVSSFV